jgi:hypothetical protein
LNVTTIARGCLEIEIGVFYQCHGTSLGNKIKVGERYRQNIQYDSFPITTTNEKNIIIPLMLTLEKIQLESVESQCA